MLAFPNEFQLVFYHPRLPEVPVEGMPGLVELTCQGDVAADSGDRHIELCLHHPDDVRVVGVVVEQTCGRKHSFELHLTSFRQGILVGIQDMSLNLVMRDSFNRIVFPNHASCI